MSRQTTFTQFGPDAAASTLPSAFQACLPISQGTNSSPACDMVVGSLASGQGYCSQAPWSNMTYCACVNNAIPCPMVTSSACANSAFAYKPTAMLPPNGTAYAECKDASICVNVVEVGGSQNVVSNITQECGIIQNVQNIINTSPMLAALTFILFIILILLVVARTDEGGQPRFPPPPDFSFE